MVSSKNIFLMYLSIQGVSPFTELEYWTEVFSIFGQDSVVFGLLQMFNIWRSQIKSVMLQCQQYNDFMTVVVLLAFSNVLAYDNGRQFWALFDQI